MKDLTKGIIIAVAGAVICREFYAKGYNDGQDFIVDKLNLMLSVKKAVENEGKEES